jgi:sugar phosphate isomerase/epimerase
MLPALKKYNISIPSIYANSVLHKKEDAQKSIETILSVAEATRNQGTKILVTNPTPIRWGGDEVKTDEALTIQLENLEQLGKHLRGLGITLAYHTHDTEMKGGAKEFHHMLQNTSKENVSFCFDVHWIYRGSRDIGRRLREVVAAARAAHARDELAPAQLAEQLLQVGQRDVLAPADRRERHRPARLTHGQIHHRGHRKPAFGRESHGCLEYLINVLNYTNSRQI